MSGESVHTPHLMCPFCQSANVEIDSHEIYDACWFVRCRACQARGPEWQNTHKALAFWNARTAEERSLVFVQNPTMKQETP